MRVRLIKLGISLALGCVDGVRARIGYGRHASCVVLYYHSIPTGKKSAFARQMDLLLCAATPLSPDYQGRLAPGRRYAMVTFDDGFMSVLENGLPELRARAIPCAVFVPTGSVGTIPSWLQSEHPDASERVMPTSTLRTLTAGGLVTIGSHSVSHPNFRHLDDESARSELVISKSVLETMSGTAVLLFSFPYGSYSDHSIELARQAGYHRVFTIDPRTHNDDPKRFLWGRVRVDLDDWPIEFRLKVQGAYRWLSVASTWKRRGVGLAHALRSALARAIRRAA